MGKGSILMVILCAGFFSPPVDGQDRSSENVYSDPDDPLPKGALARLGTLRWRQNYLSHVAFLPDGKTTFPAWLSPRMEKSLLLE